MADAAKPLLFISHRSTDTAAARLVNAALADRFKTFLDAEHIDAGADWKQRIETALDTCDAAVLLLSPEVVAHPAWVAYEVAQLVGRRRRLPSGLLILPVLLPGFTPENLKTTDALGPAELDAIQAVPFDPAAPDLKRLLAALEPLARAFEARTPFEEIEKHVALLLSELPDKAIGIIVREMGLSEQELEGLTDPSRWLAAKLLRADLAALESAHGALPRSHAAAAVELFRTVAPYCWIDAAAAGTLHREATATPPKKPIAMHAAERDTPRLYVRRASLRYPPWLMLDCDGDYSDGSPQPSAMAETLLGNIRKELARKLRFRDNETPTDAALNKEFEKSKFGQGGHPFVVFLPSSLKDMDGALLRQLRTPFPRAVFLLWSSQIEETLAARFDDLLVLTPALDPEDEKGVYRAYDRCLDGLPRL